MTDTLLCARCDKPDDDQHAIFAGHRFEFAVTTAADVDDHVLSLAEMIVDGWYDSGPVDWENVWDRMDGQEAWAGVEGPRNRWAVSMGSELDTPAQRKIQREIRKRRRG